MAKKYQTLSGFLLSPFHKKADVKKDVEYSQKYSQFIRSNRIYIHAMCIIEDSYYIHVKVPSESQKNGNYEYDVIIRFFTDDPEVAAQNHLRSYYIQFFSNSPSFMYQYAYLYKEGGYLINALYDKLDPDYIDKPPEKTNKDMNLSYDKSIYFACRYLSDMQFRYLGKTGPLLMKKVNEDKFFRDITDFKSIKIDTSIMNEEKKLSKLLDNKSPKKRKENSNNNGKKIPSKNTSTKTKSITILKKKSGGHVIVKKKPTRSTKKR